MARQNPWTQMLPQLMANMIMQRMNQNWEAEQAGIQAKSAERQARQKLLAERIPARAVQTTQPEGPIRGVTPGPYDTYWKAGPKPEKVPGYTWAPDAAGGKGKYLKKPEAKTPSFQLKKRTKFDKKTGHTYTQTYSYNPKTKEKTDFGEWRVVSEQQKKVPGEVDYFKSPGKLIDDTRGYYARKEKTLLDDMGWVKEGKEEEFRNLTSRMDKDFKLIRQGKLPSWLEEEKMPPGILQQYKTKYPGRSDAEIIEAWKNR